MLLPHMTRGKRVVVTGIGLRSPLGHTLPALRAGLLAGRSGVRAMPEWAALLMASVLLGLGLRRQGRGR